VICHNGLEIVPEHNDGSSREYWTMHFCAIQQDLVRDDGLIVVNLEVYLNIMNVK
jgi:hypothetical protein